MTTTNSISSTKRMVWVALFTAITCILAPLSIPIPISPVPITLTNLVLFISLYILSWKEALISYILYLLLGICGLPVFSGFSGGIGKLAGPTGGYLAGFIFLILIAGFFMQIFPKKKTLTILGMVLGMAATYIFGTLWLAAQMELSFTAALSVGVFPYLLGDAVKIAAASIVGPILQNRLFFIRDNN